MQYINIPKHTEQAIKNKMKALHLPCEEIWKRTREQYDFFLQETPDIGGKSNPLWEQMYTAIGIFAFYEITGKTLTCEEIEELAVESLIGNNRQLGKIIDFNWKWVQRLYGLLYRFVKKQADKHIEDGRWNNTWRFELNPEGTNEGVNVHLIGCPVYDFAKKHGYETIMRGLCASDYKVFEPFRCSMIRYHTVANGDGYCDFWQVGNKSKAWKDADKEKLI